MVRTLVKIEYRRLIPKFQTYKQSDPEETDPEKLQALFLHGSRRRVLAIGLSQGETIVFLPSGEPPIVWLDTLNLHAVQKAGVRILCLQLPHFVQQDRPRKPSQILFLTSATAVFSYQLISIDGVTNTTPPVIQLLSHQRISVLAARSWTPLSKRVRDMLPTLQQAFDTDCLFLRYLRDCGL